MEKKDMVTEEKTSSTGEIQEKLLKAKRTGIVKEFLLYFAHHKSYWIVPIVIFVLLLIALVAIIAITGGAAAPLIYTLF
jgi:hypothetical protein